MPLISYTLTDSKNQITINPSLTTNYAYHTFFCLDCWAYRSQEFFKAKFDTNKWFFNVFPTWNNYLIQTHTKTVNKNVYLHIAESKQW